MPQVQASKDEALKQMADFKAGLSTALKSAEADLKQRGPTGICIEECFIVHE